MNSLYPSSARLAFKLAFLRRLRERIAELRASNPVSLGEEKMTRKLHQHPNRPLLPPSDQARDPLRRSQPQVSRRR